jgi:hypothetical protein
MDMEQQERLAQLRNRKSAHPAVAGRIVAAGLSSTAFLLGIASLAASAKVAPPQVESPAVIAEVPEPVAVEATDPPATDASPIAPTSAAPATTAAPTTMPAPAPEPVTVPSTEAVLVEQEAPVDAPPDTEAPPETEAPVVQQTQAPRPKATNPAPAPAPKPVCSGSKC